MAGGRRGDVLVKAGLLEALTSSSTSSVASLIGIKGMGGVGKTVLASLVVNDGGIRAHFADGGIVWVNALVEGGDVVASVVSTVANRMHAQLLTPRFGANEAPPSGTDAVRWIKERVAEHSLRVLVVLDNAMKPEVVTALSGCGLRLLVTTREQAVATAGGATLIEVDCVDDATARRMLASAAGLDGDLPAEAEAVLKACARLPLALAVAGATFATDKTLSWAQLAAEWHEVLGDSLPMDDPMLETQASRHASLFAMVELSLSRLPRAVRKAYRGLTLAPKRMPLDDELLCTLLGASDAATAVGWRDTLASCSLLQLAADGTCTAHDLQLDYLRKEPPPPEAIGRLQGWLVSGATLDRLADEDVMSSRPLLHALLALWREVERARGGRVAAAACEGATAMRGDDVEAARRLHATTDLLRRMDCHDAAMRLSERALAIKEAAHGPEHTAVATTLVSMGVVLWQQGKLAEAIPLAERAERTFAVQLGAEHPDTLKAQKLLAAIRRSRY